MKRGIIIGLLIFLLVYGWRLWQQPVYNLPTDRPIRFQGKITSQPYIKGSKQIIKMGPISVLTDRFPAFFYGQEIMVTGTLKPGVSNRLQKQYWAYFPAIETSTTTTIRTPAERLGGILQRLKIQGETILWGFYPEPLGGLLAGIVLGSKGGMSPEFAQNLRETGTIHTVVASGQNISLLTYLLLAAIGLWLGRKKAIWPAAGLVWLYVFLTGGEAPVVRAAVMAQLVWTAQIWGREAVTGIVFLVTGALMLVVKPLLLFDLGFQLSFAATAGLLWLAPVLRQTRFFKGESLAIEAIRSSLAAQLAVLPLILTQFGYVSGYSLIVNALVVWTTPLLMVLGFVIILVGAISSGLGQITAYLAWPLLFYFTETVQLFSRLPGAKWQVGEFSGWWVAGYAAVLGVWARITNNRNKIPN